MSTCSIDGNSVGDGWREIRYPVNQELVIAVDDEGLYYIDTEIPTNGIDPEILICQC